MKKKNGFISLAWFWLTNNITRAKQIVFMGLLSALAWATLIVRDYYVPDLYGSNPFVRWDFWLGIAGTLFAWGLVVWLGRADKRRRKKQEADNRLKG